MGQRPRRLASLLRDIAASHIAGDAEEEGPERGEDDESVADIGAPGDGALQTMLAPPTISATGANFEGISNQDNFNIFGVRVNPPDPVGDVGPNNYVEMANLAFAVFNKSGTAARAGGRSARSGRASPITDCTDPSGDPVVLYDQLTDRWILTQFTTSGLDDPTLPFWNCVAVSTTGDPTGSVLPVRVRDGNFQILPGLPEVRRVDGLVRPHDP